MSLRRVLGLLVLAGVLLVGLPAGSAPAEASAFPGVDCTSPPTPDMPGQGLAAFFEKAPDPLPRQEDPFAKGTTTTIYQQYGYAGLRWRTYDLGCGADIARDPSAVMGTTLSNWLVDIPIAMAALTGSLTDVAFVPTFLDGFDPVVRQISQALHDSLFATWVPAVIALLGIAILLKARRSALATTAAAIGWALMVVLVTTAVFRWPLGAGHVADETVSHTLGSVVSAMDGQHRRVPPSVALSSTVQESVLYRSWLAGTLGSADSRTAITYGPRLFKAQALTWREAYVVEHDPVRGKAIIEHKQDQWRGLAGQIKADDPAAYENLQGKRSDTRIGYALLSTVTGVFALLFLLVCALMLLGSFLIVRLAVMLFPAFAVLGVFPAGRSVVIGIGRTVGAALVNAVVFGIGAAVTIRVMTVILDPHSQIPGWLAMTLTPLFGFVMWVALKPVRRLTTMVSPTPAPLGDETGRSDGVLRRTGGSTRRIVATGAVVSTVEPASAQPPDLVVDDDRSVEPVPDRLEAQPLALDPTEPGPRVRPALTAMRVPDQRRPAFPALAAACGGSSYDEDGWVGPPTTVETEPAPRRESEWVGGEEILALYRPTGVDADDVA